MIKHRKSLAALLLAAAIINIPPAPAAAGKTDTDQAVEKITDIGKAVIDMAGDAAGKAGASIRDKLGEKEDKASPSPREKAEDARQKNRERIQSQRDDEEEAELDTFHRFLRLIFIRQHIQERLPQASRYAAIDTIPDNMRYAIIAMEDRKFYEHHGLDLEAIVRAFLVNMQSGEIEQGASTITQQLVKNLFLTGERTYARKLEELVLSIFTEARCDKDEILEYYLNSIYYGGGYYGLKDASYGYFGKAPADLTLAECAMLAGMPQAPSVNSPYKDYDAAVKRRNIVLKSMVAAGYITATAAEQAKAEPLILAQ
ncbi:MAG: transglycosylase domain-containing protein [Selenomonadaceae bacterium]|nr:transglycosylase domain-containing protein [Selenomonadaceae bacterium]